MKLGISIASAHPGLSDADAVQTVIDRARVAAEAGLDHLSLGDQHATGPGMAYVQNVPTIGRILADWPADRPIGLLLLLPLWHPVLAAEQIGTLASMSTVPFIVQTGIGSGDAQFAAMGATTSTRRRVTDEATRVIKRLLAGEAVDSAEFGISGASIRPRPPVGVEWWVGAGRSPTALDRAARDGDAWYVSPALDGTDLVETIADYRSACDRHGSTPQIALRRDVLVGDDHDATVALAREIIDRGYRGMDRQVISGGVDAVAERMSSFGTLGVGHIVARTISVDRSTALRSVELLGAVRERIT